MGNTPYIRRSQGEVWLLQAYLHVLFESSYALIASSKPVVTGAVAAAPSIINHFFGLQHGPAALQEYSRPSVPDREAVTLSFMD